MYASGEISVDWSGVPKKTGHRLISCHVKAIKAIAMIIIKIIAFRKDYTLDFDIYIYI
jgi:hypothetical protein